MMAEPKLSVKSLLCAWILCAGILVAGEIVMHALPARTLLAFDQHQYNLSAAMDCTTVRRINVLQPAADVLVIGSSREREGFVMPYLKEQLAKMGVPCSDARNYAQANGRAPTQYALLRMLREAGHMPRLLIYGVTPLQISHIQEEHAFTASFVPLGDLLSPDTPLENADRIRYLGIISLSTLDRYIRTFWLRELVRAHGDWVGAAEGGLTRRQANLRRASLKNGERSLQAEKEAVAKAESDQSAEGETKNQVERMEPKERRKADVEFSKQCARQALHLAAQGGCHTIVVELPVSHDVQMSYPKGVYDEFVEFFGALSREVGAPFIRVSDLGIDLQDSEMLDRGHMNWTGAEKFTRALTAYLAQHPDILARAQRDGERAALR